MIIDVGSGNKNINFHQGGGGKAAKIEERKAVTYTDNGTFAVNPDEGYDAIKGADVTVDVKGTKSVIPQGMCLGYTSLSDLNLNNFDLSQLTDLKFFFSDFEGNKFNIEATFPNVTSVRDIFQDGCYSVDIIAPKFTFLKLTSFQGILNLIGGYRSSDFTFDGRNIKAPNTVKMGQLMEKIPNYSKTLTIYPPNIDSITDLDSMCRMIRRCIVHLEDMDTSKVTNMNGMFYNAYGTATVLGLEKLDTSNVTDFRNMFSLSMFSELNLSNFDLSKAIYNSGMFGECKYLKKLVLSSKFFASSLTTYNFSGATVWDDADSLATFVDALPQLDGTTKTVKLSTATKNALTDEQKTTIANKGWTIA